MTAIRNIAVALMLAIGFALPGSAQQPHWLTGIWEGSLGNLPTTTRFGPERTLTVASVAASGASAKGTWVGANSKANVDIAIAGDTISFTTPGSSGASYKLAHKGNALEGTWSPTGGRGGGTVTLKKK